MRTKVTQVNILGSRGVPSNHSGFEFFAHHFSCWLAARGIKVVVYCQGKEASKLSELRRHVDFWNGVERVHFNTLSTGTLGTMEFDLRCALDVIRRPGVDLVLGYNTAIFNLCQSIFLRRVFMNMDGVEWKRGKWSRPAKLWFWLNELIGANSFRPIADHPNIVEHLRLRSLRVPTMIPYGSPAVYDAPTDVPMSFGLEPGNYFLVIARPVPENSLLEIVRGFSSVSGRLASTKLVVLGRFDQNNAYHRSVLAAASESVVFLGAIFDQHIVGALRFHCKAYIHGHTVGGTNPSLVEALGAGNAVIAHDNPFNRWVAGGEQMYFRTPDELCHALLLTRDDASSLARMRLNARARHSENFTFDAIHSKYAQTLGVLE